jgi:ABC-type lipoprotein release transport system permease subunit
MLIVAAIATSLPARAASQADPGSLLRAGLRRDPSGRQPPK